MRIGCLQFAPQVADVDNNLNRADACLARADPTDLENLDLLVLPEMAFSGYNFKSLEQIMPFTEPAGAGISALWARTTALKYDCVVAVGYPEKIDSSRQRRFSMPRYYNSLIMVNGDGETLANYRKSFLYYTDATWAQEGSGFFGGHIQGFGQVAMGICMDINPYKFEAPWNAYEFGFHILEAEANLVVVSMAWLTQEDPATFTPFTQEPDMETISYWVQRLEPVVRKEQKDEIIVVFCNRCGIEDDVVYAGTSAVVGIKNGEVSVYGLLGRGVKELLVVDTDRPPFAKLMSRDRDPEPQPEVSAPIIPVPPSMVSPAKASPIKDRLSRLPEADEPAEDLIPASIPSPANTSGLHTSPTTTSRSPAATTPMTQIGPPLPIIGVTNKSPRSHYSRDDKNEDIADYGGFSHYESSATPDASLSTTQAFTRPKLAISTKGSQEPAQPSIRDLCTPPMTAYDDAPMTAIDDIPMSGFPTRYNRHHPPAFSAASSANVITPEEPVWPIDIDRTTRIPVPLSLPGPTSESSVYSSQEPPTPRGRPDQRRPATESNLGGHDLQALRTAVGESGIVADIPARPDAPKSRNASRDVSRCSSRSGNRISSRDSSRNPSREPSSRDLSRNRGRNTSRDNSRCANRDRSRAPSRKASQTPSRQFSRETSLTRDDAKHCQPPETPRGRARSSRAKSSSPSRCNPTAPLQTPSSTTRNRSSESRKAAKSLLSSVKDSIPIAINTSLIEEHRSSIASSISRTQHPASSLSHRRSRSTSNVPLHHAENRPSSVSANPRITTDFSSVWSSQGQQHADPPGTSSGIRNGVSFDSLYLGLRNPETSEDEAFLGRSMTRAETWRRKRESRAGSASGRGSRSASASVSVTPVERAPEFFF